MERFHCPVDNCRQFFETADELQGHVAGAARSNERHRRQRDSESHRLDFYLDQCRRDDGVEQATL